eukprot:c16481_g1_i1.p1 GENE.c16481_g1_i1~~c16481_g1_i1.p1  ORF type:complete len:226 (+),score=91.57 c16481_g1_i1:50-727(+)
MLRKIGVILLNFILLNINLSQQSEKVYPFPIVPDHYDLNEDGTIPEQPTKPTINLASHFTLSCSGISELGNLFLAHGCLTSCDKRCEVPSLEISWENIPNGTRSLVILIDRKTSTPPHKVHWLLTNIPAYLRGLKLGANQKDSDLHGAREWMNSFGTEEYSGPCGKEGNTYRIVLLALACDKVDLHDFFEENPTALGNEIQHHLITHTSVLDAQLLPFTYPPPEK